MLHMLSQSRLIPRQLILPPSLLRVTMTTFVLPKSRPAVTVSLIPDISQEQLLSFPAFKTWIETLQGSLRLQSMKSHSFHSAPYVLRKIDVQAVDFFGREKRLGFVKLAVDISTDDGEKLPGSVFLRGGSVAMMVIHPFVSLFLRAVFQFSSKG